MGWKYQDLDISKTFREFESFLLPFFFFGLTVTCGILVPPPETEPMTLTAEAEGLNHWTAR